MSLSERQKGVKGEAEARRLWESYGFEVRGLEGGGDHFIVANRVTFPEGKLVEQPVTLLAEEVKRQERLQLWRWLEQAERDAPEGVPFVVTFRRNRGHWYSAMRTTHLAGLLR